MPSFVLFRSVVVVTSTAKLIRHEVIEIFPCVSVSDALKYSKQDKKKASSERRFRSCEERRFKYYGSIRAEPERPLKLDLEIWFTDKLSANRLKLWPYVRA